MTIGANLNGGSLTLGGTSINIGPTNTTRINMGGPNTTVNVSSGTINASLFKLYSTYGADKACWLDTIGVGNSKIQLVLGYINASEVYIGSPKTPIVVIGGDGGTLKIANDGLIAGASVKIATGPNNVGNSQVIIGSSTLSTVLLNGVNVVMNDQTGSKVQIGGKDMDIMYLRSKSLLINDGNNTDYINNGNTVVGNSYGTGYTFIKGGTVGLGDDGGDIYLGSTDPVPGKTSKLYIRTPITAQYNPSQINNTYHIGYKFSASFFGALFPYSGGNRAFGWWYIPPGVYVISYSSMFNRTTAYYKTFIYFTTQAPNSTNYLIDMVGGGYSEASVAEWNNEAVGYHRVTGSACITLYVASYIAISQNFFYPGGPTDTVGYGIDVVRVG